VVVNIVVKRRDQTRQVGIGEQNVSESLTTHRNVADDIKTREATGSWDKHGRNLFTVHAVSGVKATGSQFGLR
jgi:hypothetical protein